MGIWTSTTPRPPGRSTSATSWETFWPVTCTISFLSLVRFSKLTWKNVATPPCSLLTLSVCVRPFARARVRPCEAAKAAPSARRRPSDSSWPLPRPVRPSACGVKVSGIRLKKKTFMQNSDDTEKFRTSSSTVLKDKLLSGLIRYKITYFTNERMR